MSVTAAPSTQSLTSHRASRRAESDRAGWIPRWARKDPVRTAATILIVFQLLWRWDIATRGYLTVDDFALASRAAESDLTPTFLFSPYFGDHFLPAAKLIFWLLTNTTGLDHWPYVVLLMTGQALLSVAFYRLLRLLLRPGWGVLVPLSLLLFSPLTLGVSSWATVGIQMLPMQLTIVLAIGAQVKYARTRRRRHLATLALSVALGLIFTQKSLLIVPLVFLVATCLLVTGGPLRSVIRAVRRYWPSWAVLSGLSIIYVGLYVSQAEPALRQAVSASEVLSFVRLIVGANLIPGLLGGPWQWENLGDDTLPLVNPADLARWLSWAVFLALIVITIRLRPSAARAWVLLATYTTLVVGLFAATRLGSVYGSTVGRSVVYVGDVVVVAALCMGVAMMGLIDTPEPASVQRAKWLAALRTPSAIAFLQVVAFVPLAAFGAGAAWSAAGFNEIWSVRHGRDYLHNAQADLATAPAGTVFFDRTVPGTVMSSFAWPYNLQSHFFRPLDSQPVFVTEGENVSLFDATGHIRPAAVGGTPTHPGPIPGCGYRLTDGETIRMPLISPMFVWHWVIRVGYLSSGESTAVFRLGEATYDFEIHRGLHQIFFPITGGGDAVELRLTDPSVKLCVDQVTVGNLVPRP